jgi:hypothetical protein
MSPFDAISKVKADCATRTARFYTFGVGFGGQGYWGNDWFSTREEAEAEYERRTVELREIYGAPGKFQWTGKFIEEPVAIMPGSTLLKGVRFVPLKKNGRKGVRVQTLHLYPISISEQQKAEVRQALPYLTIS